MSTKSMMREVLQLKDKMPDKKSDIKVWFCDAGDEMLEMGDITIKRDELEKLYPESENFNIVIEFV